ncbi:MAG: hypothetical protein QNJ94_06615 [Alphaproteobacteria bacterium]|nr:hypothetical protein [Alphaproteobacteria bacterium]
MTKTMNRTLAAVLMGLGWTLASSAALAESNAAVQHAGLRKVCIEHDGRFERSWLYNDQGMQWGEQLSCTTDRGFVTCRDKVCRSGRWTRADGVAVEAGRQDRADGATRFPAEPVALADALAALAAK